MLVELIYYSNFWLNCFPRCGGVSKTVGPRTTLTGQKIDYNKHCRLEFGEYCQVDKEHDNTMATRTIEALALCPTGNEQDSYYFFSLVTGKVLNRQQWTPIPVPAHVINHVNRMARQQKAMGHLLFTDMYGDPIQNDGDNFAGVEDQENQPPNPGPDSGKDDDDTNDETYQEQEDNEHGLMYQDDIPEAPEHDLGLPVNDVPPVPDINQTEMGAEPQVPGAVDGIGHSDNSEISSITDKMDLHGKSQEWRKSQEWQKQMIYQQ